MKTITLTQSEAATVLAALRLWPRLGDMAGDDIQALLHAPGDDDGEHSLELGFDQIDALCERISGAGPDVIEVGVSLEGGVVQSVFSPTNTIEATIYDYDTDGADSGDIKSVRQSDGSCSEALVYDMQEGPSPLLIVEDLEDEDD
jgi:hypothetical protein